jgi:hypothetical protein
MIEVRSSYRVTMPDAEGPVEELAQQGRETVWPILGWSGRIQQMLHGHSQQSLFVWSSQWPSLAAWEEAMVAAAQCDEYRAWRDSIAPRLLYGASQEVYEVLEPSRPADNTPRKIEVRSAYVTRLERIEQAREHMVRAQEIPDWSGQNQQLICGTDAPGKFVWSSTWDSMAVWEQAMGAGDDEHEGWFAGWVALVEFGSTREVFRNL